MWPFARWQLGDKADFRKKVFAHYFPAWTISIDNRPIQEDYWNTAYLRRGGEKGKYFAEGGFVRQRPLPAGPWKSPYWRYINAAIEIERAKLIGVDGFGVDIAQLSGGKYWDEAQILCLTAAATSPDFYIVLEPDADILKGTKPLQMADAIARLAQCPATYRLPDGRLLVIPFSAQTESVDYWKEVIAILQNRKIPIAFVPDLLDPAHYADAFASISAGLTFWGWRDPDTINNFRNQTLLRHWSSLTPNWMQFVSPQDARPKAGIFWEAANTELFRDLWSLAITNNSPYVHIVTWNAYPEASQIAPSTGSQFLFYDLAAFYIAWYKTGVAPRVLSDALYFSHRTQIFTPDRPPRPTDLPYKRLGLTPLKNDIEMVALLRSPATLEINIGGQSYRQEAAAGLSTFRVPAAPGHPSFKIIRGNVVVVEKRSDWTIDAKPDVLNGDYFGGSSTRSFIMPPASKTR